ncbi:MAG: UDP-N-acetylglucosamine 1-carboxyvinyltransferase [Clostridia bacterium]|nr:UDP-N-acetylglucosamine 1-carboxyvinyltransferase [Clostridia bacterium]
MDSLVIKGKKRLGGTAEVHGAKNSALPLLAASAAVGGECVFHNIPDLSDVRATLKILRSLGCFVDMENGTALCDSTLLCENEISHSLMRVLRSSFIFMGALLSRTGKASMCTPGGCEIGLRPVDIHLSAFEQMGISVNYENGRIICEADSGIRGADIDLPIPSVGATENIMIAASRADGVTYIRNAAREPEIEDLSGFLNACGAKISGAGESTIVIEGVEKLHPAEYTVMPDRIEAASFLACAAVTGSDLLVKNTVRGHLNAVISVFEQAGCRFSFEENGIYIKSPPRLRKMKTVRTMPYPGFPTDCQAVIMAMASIANGTTIINENIFENRFSHAGELNRMGADITVSGKTAIVNGVRNLYGANVKATDLRGGMALVLAGLAAYGETNIDSICYIDRGYEKIERSLSLIGADIRRKKNGEAESG